MADQFYQLEHGNVLALDHGAEFPVLTQALTEPNGLIAIGGELTSQRLLDAYRRGIFPWFSEGEPVLWWSPDPRMVLFPAELKLSTSLKKTLKKNKFTTSTNTAFRDVITACSQAKRPDQAGTWIHPDMINAYCELHALGYAISSESWLGQQLVGGCYGVIIGNMFYGESMFHTEADASKVAFVNLVRTLRERDVGMIDCQMKTPLLSSFGGREIPRDVFSQKLTTLVNFNA